nr:MAG TPA: hypothetical protein [Crassvirales sp.]
MIISKFSTCSNKCLIKLFLCSCSIPSGLFL